MTWTLKYDNALQIIELAFQGHVDGPEVHAATSGAIAMIKEHDVLEALIDTTAMASAPPIIDIYELPTKQFISEDLSYEVRCALIVPESSRIREAARFYETTCINRGRSVRSFSSRKEAIAWLKRKAADNSPIADIAQ